MANPAVWEQKRPSIGKKKRPSIGAKETWYWVEVEEQPIAPCPERIERYSDTQILRYSDTQIPSVGAKETKFVGKRDLMLDQRDLKNSPSRLALIASHALALPP